MASRSQRHANAVGLQRFGLGVKIGQAEALLDGARDLILNEIRADSIARPAGIAYVGTADISTAFYAFADAEKKAREAPRVAQANVPATPGAGADGGAATPRPPAEPPLPTRIYRDEVMARTRLALEAPAGFGERLVQFWSNHFCVAVNKNTTTRIMAGAFEREAIRPHVFGRFADMLLAAESHPAMLEYLDNQLSTGPNSPAGNRRGRGLNENLGREILELHTLGVGGGYTQADVTSLARIITGWMVAPRNGALGTPGVFAFNPRIHEPGAQQLLGKLYDQPDKAQGVAALADLARHPATARFVATKLVRHFVADEPPAALVDDIAAAFRRSEGDLAVVSRALVESDAVWSAEPAKIRSPQEFLIAAFRALGREPDAGQVLGTLGVMGQPVWQPPGPNGYPDTNAAWASPQGLKTRIDVAARLGQQAAGGIADPRQLSEEILGPLLTPETRQAVARAESKPQALALLLMSPEFQRR
ncbi:uncharacterized protein (DUF1800 family) [Pseudochelatococcus lubricantis]|uniref:Uncharacterized protein (DUF1800 family) n=1 Tax=Pseudochelatococcus lubricantis TaxID=1538102 RepID=A0ABX0V3K7_9HYPH|nr:DUF1800 family protein [Pseudochelatococcus lubricantis]NIJ59716.1 uncharacterized protein (DUF1800 family) [Pseudochelatococcus lubricantis]